MVEVIVVESSAQAGALAADRIAHLVSQNSQCVLGLATGSTPLPIWHSLARRQLDFTHVRGFALDEYLGLPVGHPQAYASVINREITAPLGMHFANVRVPADRGDVHSAGQNFEQAIQDAGGVDVQVLGIGRNGHIGFNEPGSSLASRTRIKTLARETREDNARFFGSIHEVPHQCITQGVGTILEARSLILLAFGAAKSAVVAAAVEGPIQARVPASAIQLHWNATVIVDEAAAADLAHRDYYRQAWKTRLVGP